MKLVLFAIYFPTAFVGYYFLGDCVQDNMISSMSDGIMKKVAEGVMMTHLITAVPIVINPPSQYFEEIMDIPKCRWHVWIIQDKIINLLFLKIFQGVEKIEKLNLVISDKRYIIVLKIIFLRSIQLEKNFISNVYNDCGFIDWSNSSKFWCNFKFDRR